MMYSPLDKQQRGKDAEAAALDFLQQQGLILVQRNYRCYFGEIDIIMQDGEHLVFIEVRSRQHIHYGSALESITQPKQQKIIKAATHFLQRQQWLHRVTSRFDVIAIQYTAGKMQLEWIKHAFEKRVF